MKLENLLDRKRTKLDNNRIWITNLKLSEDVAISQKAWEKIYNFNINKLRKDRKDFNVNKLDDHISYITKFYKFNSNIIYLELGCGPAYIADHLMKKYNCYFIGVDFNYKMLVTLKKYFDSLGYKKYLLIHADINNMPIKDNAIDFIYGGGVIEHFRDTNHIIKELYRILNKGGVSFNTVPAFNFSWPVIMHKNIPSFPILKQVFEFIHLKILKNKLLVKHHGYELSYRENQLKRLHSKVGFSSSFTGAFAFHPSTNRLQNKFLRDLYFKISSYSLFSPMIYIAAQK